MGKPLLAASAAFLAGAFLGCTASRDVALALGAVALVCALRARMRFAALGLALGLIFGLLPLVLGMRRDSKGLAISGFIVCFLLGPVSGLLSIGVFAWKMASFFAPLP